MDRAEMKQDLDTGIQYLANLIYAAPGDMRKMADMLDDDMNFGSQLMHAVLIPPVLLALLSEMRSVQDRFEELCPQDIVIDTGSVGGLLDSVAQQTKEKTKMPPELLFVMSISENICRTLKIAKEAESEGETNIVAPDVNPDEVIHGYVSGMIDDLLRQIAGASD